jgi:hypothetical protein
MIRLGSASPKLSLCPVSRELSQFIDIDRAERHGVGRPPACLHVIADSCAGCHHPSKGANGEDRLGERRLQLLQRLRRLVLLRLQHVGTGLCRIDAGCRAGNRGRRLIAGGLRLLERLAAGIILGGERLLPCELELGAGLSGLRRGKLCLGLIDGYCLRRDLLADAVDGRLLGGDIVLAVCTAS